MDTKISNKVCNSFPLFNATSKLFLNSLSFQNCSNSRKKRSSRTNDVKYNIVSAGPVVMAKPLKVFAKPPSTVAQMSELMRRMENILCVKRLI